MVSRKSWRNELTELEQSLALARRKEIYEARWPETRAKVAGARASNKKQGKKHDANETVSFASDAAAKTGKTARAVQYKTKIGQALKDVAEEVAATPIADLSVLSEGLRYFG